MSGASGPSTQSVEGTLMPNFWEMRKVYRRWVSKVPTNRPVCRTQAADAVSIRSVVVALIGVGEALITVAALAFIGATRADLFRLRDAQPA